MPQKKNLDDASVLEKAILVISEKGPDAFTLADISQVVGLAPATLMQRFGSKRSLLIQAAKHVPAKLKEDLVKLKEQKLSWDNELMMLLTEAPEGFGSRQEIANSLGLLKLDMIDPELHPIARELMQGLRTRIKELLEQAKAEGALSKKVDIESLSWELDALRHGLVIQWTLSGSGTLQKWLQKGLKNYLKEKKA